MKHLFIPPDSIQEGRVSLSPNDVHHIKTVLRKKIGDSLLLSDGERIYRGTIETLDAATIIVSALKVERESGNTASVTLAHALIKAPNLELALTKSVETGVSVYQPLLTERCCMPSRELATRKRDRFLRKIDEAAKQCGRPDLMEFREPLKLEKFLEAERQEKELKLFLDIGVGRHLTELTDEIHQAGRICLIIGPEGGFSNKEKGMIEEAGFLSVTCGDFLWRSETAVIVATGFLQSVLSLNRL